MSQYTQPQPQPGQFAAPAPARNGLGTAALVLGIIGLVFAVIPFLFWIGTILGLLALILGIVGRGRAKRGEATNKGVALAGTVLGLVGIIVSVIIGIVTVMAVDDAVDEINKAVENTAPKDTTAGGTDGAAEGDAPKDETKSLAADETSAYEDNVEVTVSAPKPYTPGEFAIGHTKGNKAYQVTITIENAGKEKFDTSLVTADARAGKDGVTAEQIFDDKAGTGFEGTILPGKKATVTFAFDAPADAKNLTVEVSPGFDYDASQWELTL
ncbi:DUF4190 domain-containing protein [Streptomyces pristinaespiralis]|jgi:hypothetical protein|uniref:Predicted protein n=2 Tax=Streptomyces pristinaespiralis TaxID=38300 RepID=D6X5Z8_STRE2|nr:DUF4190 domain-containing protein [Streptomyces pristinaespiralis]ALC22742.1 hypothetical protein SPRI_4436 [Streptomyces pristinaespiralis]EFH31474.1 predicted protein [Streptomyces pristinaespiralis ATCC 25486]QMU14696.1 DUF4190 and DUF4352 domain-containing protein [Streptomyces pristinaespiralis]